MGLFSYLFGSDNTRHLKKVEKIVDKIEEKSDYYKNLTDEECLLCAYRKRNKDIGFKIEGE